MRVSMLVVVLATLTAIPDPVRADDYGDRDKKIRTARYRIATKPSGSIAVTFRPMSIAATPI